MKGIREEQGNASRYRETIKGHIYWLLNFFKTLHENTKIEQIRREVSDVFMGFKDYITEFSIEKELQALADAAHTSLSHPEPQPVQKNPTDSIFTEDL